MASARLTALVLALLAGVATTAPAAPVECGGRYVVTRATGTLVSGPGDVVVLDGVTVVLDPACGAALGRARRSKGRWRLAARWRDCREAETLRLRLTASTDCTLLRGVVRGRRRPSRFVAVASRCGDGVVDPGRGERCDDGNLVGNDGCDGACGACVDPATLASTWAAVQANVFDRACTSCHGQAATAGLDLRAPGSYAEIVGVPVPGDADLFQVAPGDRTKSLVWLKVAKATFGALDDLPGGGMPLGYPLAPEIVDAFGTWIDAGAPAGGWVAGAESLLVPCGG